jgi:2-alkyl-3-oxoalkanoate reductase
MATVFVTGPTGVLGRATIPRLLAGGHTVRALSRSAANDRAIRDLGAEPMRADLFDTGSLETAMTGADAVLHLATRIPPATRMRRPEAWAENDRVRAEGSKRLANAALAAGVRTFIYPSFAYVYPDNGDSWIDATVTPVAPTPNLRSTIAAEAEVLRFAQTTPATGQQRRGVALRLGALYGPGVPSAAELFDLARRGFSLFGAAEDAYTPMLWIDDAATALLAALDRAPSGVYDVVDDQPLRQRELAEILARAVGRRRLLSPPSWMVRLMAGAPGEALMRSQRISNRRFRDATGWAPTVPNARVGLDLIAHAEPTDRNMHVPRTVRIGLAIMGVFGLFVGAWQQFLPRSFYDGFPGFGLHWVSVDGPYNEHLMRDVGGAAIGVGLITLFAMFRPSVGLVRAVAIAFLVSQVPHFTYHAVHLDLLATPLDRVLQTTSLLAILLIPLLVLLKSGEIGDGRESTAPTLPVAGEDPHVADANGLIRHRSAAHAAQ